jgi:hypothetical protein
MATYPEQCPCCAAKLTGPEIPADLREAFGGHAHFSRVIALVERDRVVGWQCPDCDCRWTDNGLQGALPAVPARS